jgi:hypothetical protein
VFQHIVRWEFIEQLCFPVFLIDDQRAAHNPVGFIETRRDAEAPRPVLRKPPGLALSPCAASLYSRSSQWQASGILACLRRIRYGHRKSFDGRKPRSGTAASVDAIRRVHRAAGNRRQYNFRKPTLPRMRPSPRTSQPAYRPTGERPERAFTIMNSSQLACGGPAKTSVPKKTFSGI